MRADLLRDGPGRVVLVGALLLAGCGGGQTSPSTPAAPTPAPSGTVLRLTSDVMVDGGQLPVDYTCDGQGVSPALSWERVPAGTREFALLMTTLPGDGTTKWNWVLYAIPASATSLARNTSGVGTFGIGSDGPSAAYQPPCSQGPGPKQYTFTLYALSGAPQVGTTRVTGAVLAAALPAVTLGSASLTVTYTRR